MADTKAIRPCFLAYPVAFPERDELSVSQPVSGAKHRPTDPDSPLSSRPSLLSPVRSIPIGTHLGRAAQLCFPHDFDDHTTHFVSYPSPLNFKNALSECITVFLLFYGYCN